VTHHAAGAAGLYGLDVHEAPVDEDGYTVDLAGLAALVERVRPRLMTIGGSLNLFPHPVAEIRAVADTVGAWVLFDAAHLCGVIAGGRWPDPLAEGAHVMTMSTYKSLGGPPGGLALTVDPLLAERLDRIAYPGLTANFDVGVTAALAVTMLDWLEHGDAYARTMVETASALSAALCDAGLPVFAHERGHTTSHQFALDATSFGGGHVAAQRLRTAGILTSAIGLPSVDGVRFGTPEVVRWGVTVADVPVLADLVVRGLTTPDPTTVAPDTADVRTRFDRIHFVTPAPA
jgi:glycine hydroxymethyltransferase